MHTHMQKKERHDLIVDLVRDERITRQDIFAQRLIDRGVTVTQASVSRDLEELGIEKVNGIYTLPSVPPAAMEFGLRSLKPAGENLIVAKCDSGLASAITVRIDAAQIDSIVGTIAGDDTIFIAVADRIKQAAAISRISQLFVNN